MKVIAQHDTADGFSIAILAVKARNGGELFEVVRVNGSRTGGMRIGAYITLHRVTTEVKARELANEEWLGDMGRGKSKMIACGPLAI